MIDEKRPWLPYVAPFAVYMVFLLLQSRLPESTLTWMYPVRAVAVLATLIYFWRYYEELKWNFSPLAVAVGLVAIVIWIGIEPFYPKLSKVEPFDPTTISPEAWKWTFIGFRVFGAVVVVAFMEEIFWRGFLIRWIINEDFKKVPMGTFGWQSFAFTVVLFGLEHNDWLAGLICGALYNWLY